MTARKVPKGKLSAHEKTSIKKAKTTARKNEKTSDMKMNDTNERKNST